MKGACFYSFIKAFSVVFVCLVVSMAVSAEMDFSSRFLLGDYVLIGKALDSDSTYYGKVHIYAQDGSIKVKRIIKGGEITGTASIETALGGDAKVLRIRFIENNIKYEETCLWLSDLDSYARITCFLYRPGVKTDNPGLEALFHDYNAN
ncbi:MAG: hypothetical protein GXO97_04745 [Nitrospirae bacterium]|nr:hypothetical protein [Nitrospirota bacterium]